MSESERYATLDQLGGRITERPSAQGVLLDLLDAASGAVERKCGGRVFTLDAEPSERLFRPRLASVANVSDIGASGAVVSVGRAGSWSALDAGDFDLAPYDALQLGEPFVRIETDARFTTSNRPTLKVSARWGWPTVPADITEAVLLLASRLYSRRSSPTGVAGFGDYGVVRVTASDADVADLLAPFQRPGFGS